MTRILIACLALAILPLPAAAQDSAARRAELSARLYELALEDRDPLLAIAAARIRGELFGQRIAREPERDAPPMAALAPGAGAASRMADPMAEAAPGEGTAPAPQAGQGDAPSAKAGEGAMTGASPAPADEAATQDAAPAGPVSAEDMLDTALALAPGDPLIAGLVEDQRAMRTKGVVSGQVYSISRIRAGGRDTYRPLEYEGNSYAEVYVEGQSGVDLNLMVYDSAGRVVCTDTDISAIAYCGWRPATQEVFSVVILNRGATVTSYTLITN
ncbi:hypothetical protein GLS40_06630 [Pseudooceanicola sp. 216_PA32_1]|uniref:Uncharacterized protein n=1 Tax=Pseudooceanicola pacificus TaxID=2676438 RepID=A0A844W4R3_9RHOB|nr:hypothetical protein [Pseudooceanicola pacificus]MWB77694.1 hypothetical protein [Pseudooceanicola pacificus]